TAGAAPPGCSDSNPARSRPRWPGWASPSERARRYPRTWPRYTVSMANERLAIEPDPVIEVFKRDIDRTLLRENLKLTVEERIRKMHAAALGAATLRAAVKKPRP